MPSIGVTQPDGVGIRMLTSLARTATGRKPLPTATLLIGTLLIGTLLIGTLPVGTLLIGPAASDPTARRRSG